MDPTGSSYLSSEDSPPPASSEHSGGETSDGARSALPENQPWWAFGFGGGRTEAIPAENGADVAENVGVKEQAELEPSRAVRFHPDAETHGASSGRRGRRADAVSAMGFVELVESLLLTHDTGARRRFGVSSSSLGTEASEADSDVDSTAQPRSVADGNSNTWDIEELETFADQVHKNMREKLEQEAAFLEVSIKRSTAIMNGTLGIEDDLRMLLDEGRLAGLGLCVIDDEQTPLERVDLSTLMTLTLQNYDTWRQSLGANHLQPIFAVPSTCRHSSARALLVPVAGGSAAAQLRSPIFKMHRELARLDSTSSDNSASGSESERGSVNGGFSGAARTNSARRLADSVAMQSPAPAGVPRLQLSSKGCLLQETASVYGSDTGGHGISDNAIVLESVNSLDSDQGKRSALSQQLGESKLDKGERFVSPPGRLQTQDRDELSFQAGGVSNNLPKALSSSESQICHSPFSLHGKVSIDGDTAIAHTADAPNATWLAAGLECGDATRSPPFPAVPQTLRSPKHYEDGPDTQRGPPQEGIRQDRSSGDSAAHLSAISGSEQPSPVASHAG